MKTQHTQDKQAAPATVLLRIDGPTAFVTLNRPHVHNALDKAAICALTQVFENFGPGVRVVVLSGLGKSFCAGADLGDMQHSITQTPAQNRADAARLSALFAAVAQAPQVVIARVHGAALGGGAGLVSCCDLVAADARARFGFTEARLGLAPAVIAPHVLRRIGEACAKRLFLTAAIIDAQAALACGLVDVVTGGNNLAASAHDADANASMQTNIDPALDAAVLTWQKMVLANSPRALATIKALLEDLARCDAKAGAAMCIDTISALRTSPEGQAGLLGFLQKKAPPWVQS